MAIFFFRGGCIVRLVTHKIENLWLRTRDELITKSDVPYQGHFRTSIVVIIPLFRLKQLVVRRVSVLSKNLGHRALNKRAPNLRDLIRSRSNFSYLIPTQDSIRTESFRGNYCKPSHRRLVSQVDSRIQISNRKLGISWD